MRMDRHVFRTRFGKTASPISRRRFLAKGIACVLGAYGTALTVRAQDSVQTAKQSSPLLVAASIDAMASIARAVGGRYAVVETILPKGAEPHAYEPTTARLTSLRSADIIVFNGFGMEPWGDKLLAALDRPDLPVVYAAEGIEPLRERPHGHDDHDHVHDAHEIDEGDAEASVESNHEDAGASAFGENIEFPEARSPLGDWLESLGGQIRRGDHVHGVLNPHVWLSPFGAVHEAYKMAEAFGRADPPHAAQYQENARRFAAAVDVPVERFRELLAQAKRRYFVVGHAAFGYLCRDFGLREVSVEGIYAEGEPSPKALARLVDFARENGVRTIFAEKAASPAVSRVLAEEVGAQVETLYTMETDEAGLGYVERLAHNLDAIGRSLAA